MRYYQTIEKLPHAVHRSIYDAFGNPVMFIDPTGMKFTKSAESLVKRYMELCLDRMGEELVSAEKDSQKAMKATKEKDRQKHSNNAEKHINATGEYKKIINELNVLRESDTLYDVEDKSYDNMIKTGPGETMYKNGAVTIVLRSGELDMIAHELKHAYQFETGKLSFGKYGRENDLLCREAEEIEAYERGELFGGESYYKHSGSYIYGKITTNVEAITDPAVLQHLANDYNTVFKHNGILYIGKNYNR